MTPANLTVLQDILSALGRVTIAYSGGVDSTLLLKVALDTLGKDKVLAVTAESPSFPQWELKEAKKLTQWLGATHLIIQTRELENSQFTDNAPDRCYWCKKELFSQLLSLAQEQGFPYVLDGSNADDRYDFRPGSKAGIELGIKSPLQEAGFTKSIIRDLSQKLKLPTSMKPALACLASRFPYGEKITGQKLKQVAQAEQLLREKGFTQIRVRHHSNIARIEVSPSELSRLIKEEIRKAIVDGFQKIGYHYITIDLEGYRPGSLNKNIDFKTIPSSIS